MRLLFNDQKLSLSALVQAVQSPESLRCELDQESWQRVRDSHSQLLRLVEKGAPIYGVTTGFGDASRRSVDPSKSETLQSNLVSYLLCGTGPHFSKEIGRAVMLCRLRSLSRGLSGVSVELIERLQMFIERDWVPAIPQEGSLGASGDLIPLAYLARVLQGEGQIFSPDGRSFLQTREVLREAGIEAYVLKAKEGLALVNGTSAMAGLTLINLAHCRRIVDLALLASSWSCLALRGRSDAFSELINSRAKNFSGQAPAAKAIREYLEDEDYRRLHTDAGELIQSRYSLRCAPQILGPIIETLELSEDWLEDEINGVSDNPVIDGQGETAMGGNFYGGYICHSMDYMKIGLAHIADMLDRQFATLIDEKANSGLTPNLVDWTSIPENERTLHHGLKGLHQSVSALTSEVMQKSIPNGIFSRSAESHNQDKVSLGLSAGVQCAAMIETMYTIIAHHLIGLAQGIDLRGLELRGVRAQKIYGKLRQRVPRVTHDQSLEAGVRQLASDLKGGLL